MNTLKTITADLILQFPDIKMEFISMVLKHLKQKDYSDELILRSFENVLYKCRFTPKLADFLSTKWTSDNPKPMSDKMKNFYG